VTLRLLALSALLAACSGDDPAPTDPPADAAAEPAAKPPAKAPPEAAPAADARPAPTPVPADAHPALTDPAQASATAPDQYTVKLETSEGDILIEVHRAWAPNGADRFYNLVEIGWFDEVRFFRNVAGFMVQFGMSPYPAATEAWKDATIPDDPVVESNKPLYVTFAKTGRPDSRSTQLFINHGDNANLDAMGFAPIGKVVGGADVVGKLHSGYGEGPPRGRGPDQGIITEYGNVYLADRYPDLDYIKHASVVK